MTEVDRETNRTTTKSIDEDASLPGGDNPSAVAVR